MRIMIQKLAVWIPAVFWVQQQYDFWPSFAEWWPWSPEETRRSSAVGITQVSSSYRPRQHWLFQIGWFQHCSREKEAQLRNLRHVIRNHKVRRPQKIPTNLRRKSKERIDLFFPHQLLMTLYCSSPLIGTVSLTSPTLSTSVEARVLVPPHSIQLFNVGYSAWSFYRAKNTLANGQWAVKCLWLPEELQL